jgi:hypothetical protein
MGPLMATALASLAAALQVALLPPETTGVPQEAVKAGAQALQRALPAPWAQAKLDEAALGEHLAAAGPACRPDLICLCSVAPFEDGALALDLRVSSLSPGGLKGWTVDVRLVEPCAGKVVDRRSLVVEATPAALSRFVGEATAQLLRGRDLPGIRWSGKPGMTVVEEAPSMPAKDPPKAERKSR